VKSLFVVLVKYIKPIDQVDAALKEHRAFLNKHYDARRLVCSGRQVPRVGGVILLEVDSRKDAEAIIQEDPFYIQKLAEYEIIEFVPSKPVEFIH
jgi:uncharacterized protein YciI